jgi:dTDP-glucose pyrophosphorylase
MNIVIPMAGLGSRFKNVGIDTPKPLIEVAGKYLVEHAISSLGITGKYIFITRKYEDVSHNEQLSFLLKSLVPDSIEIQVDKEQYGAADAALYAKDYIDNEEPLIITNCDQLFFWDSNDFLNFINVLDPDGAVAVFKSNDPKNSFAKINNNIITNIEEKNPISSDALVGLHYWKHGKDFIFSAKKLLSEYREKGFPECYISSTYNYLIGSGKNILPYQMPHNGYVSLGTPDDIEIYIGKIKEFYTNKPKTIFCDIDGTIIKHAHKFSLVGKDNAKDLDGVLAKFNEWDSKGHKIILTTARKESARYITEKQLHDLGFCWDYLLMGMTSGVRVLINDKHRETDNDRAVAVSLLTDEGFNNVDWEAIGL